MSEYKRLSSGLFQAGRGHGNAVLNFMHLAGNEFDLYARAYHRAGQALAEKMLSARGYSDTDACPIVFLYRHALELYLKAIVRVGIKLSALAGPELQVGEKALYGHSLKTLLPAVRQTFARVGWDWNLDVEGLRTFDEFEALVNDFEGVDQNSFAFRYPVDKQEQPSVPHHFMVGVPWFCQRMDPLLAMLDAATTGLAETWNEEAEFAAALQQ